MRRWVFAVLAVVFYGAAVAETFFSPIRLDLPISQLENILLLAVGAGFLVAFFLANEPVAGPRRPRS
jgi:hypothetical protein